MTMIHSLVTPSLSLVSPSLLKSHIVEPRLISFSPGVLEETQKTEKPKQKNFYLPQELWTKIFSYTVGNYLNHCRDHRYNLFRVFKSPSLELAFLKENPKAIHEIIHFTRGNFDILKPSAQELLRQINNHITELDLSSLLLTENRLHQILTWFPNIQKLTLSEEGANTLNTIKFLDSSNLEALLIVGEPSQPFPVELMVWLSTFKQLKKLELVGYKEIAAGVWRYLRTMTQLTSIKLASYPITDENMEMLSNLTGLTILHLGDCSHLSNTGFYYLSTLNELIELSIDNVPNPLILIHDQISFISSLKKLRIFSLPTLPLSFNELQIFQNHPFERFAIDVGTMTSQKIHLLRQLPLCQEFHLHCSGGFTWPALRALVSLPTLRKLHISFFHLPSVTEWDDLSRFQSHRKDVDFAISIDMATARLHDWKCLASMQELSELTLSNAKITSQLELLVPLLRLKKIVFKDNTLTERAWKDLRSLPRVIDLEFINCEITDNTLGFLASLISLETLKLPAAHLNGSSFLKLTSLKNLKKLDLTSCFINDRTISSITRFQKQLPSLHISKYATFHKQSIWEYCVSRLLELIVNLLTFMGFLLLGILIETTIIAVLVCLLEIFNPV